MATSCRGPCAKGGNEKNLAAILRGKDDLSLDQWDVPELKDNEVMIEMEVVGICGSDVHYWTHGAIGQYEVKEPMVIGHEGAGTISQVGSCVKDLQPGDRVAIEPGYGCRTCEFCKKGRYNLCPKMIFCATPPVHGLLTNYYVHPADFCFKLPDSVSFEEGALVEPLSVGLHSCNRGQVKSGDKIAVMGSGPIGLSCMLCAKAYGANKIVVADLIGCRLKVAKKMGADETVRVSECDTEEELMEKITEALCGQPDVTFDTTSAPVCIRASVKFTKTGGNVVLIGMSETEMNLPLEDPLFREVNIIGVFRYANTYQKVIDLLASGKIKAMPMVTDTFEFEKTVEAFTKARDNKEKSIKVQINVKKS